MSPPRGWNLNVSRALRELGVSGGTQMELADGPVTPVVVMNDQTQFVASQVEPRGVMSTDIIGLDTPLNRPPEFVVLNRAPGGIFIENLTVTTQAITSPDARAFDTDFDLSAISLFTRLPNAKVVLSTANVNVLTVGSPPLSLGFANRSHEATAVVEQTWFGTPFTSASGWFIPAGRQLSIRSNAHLVAPFTLPAPRLVVALTFREVPAIG